MARALLHEPALNFGKSRFAITLVPLQCDRDRCGAQIALPRDGPGGQPVAGKLATLNAELSRYSNDRARCLQHMWPVTTSKSRCGGIHKYAHYLMEEAQAGAFSEQAKERLEGLQRLTVRMDGLLEALLHFSRVGQLRLEFQEISLAAVLNEAAEMLGARIEESGAKIRVPRNLPVIRCDRIRVREILANLISNAIKYNEQPDKWVEVGYLEPGENPPAACGARPAHAHAEAQYSFRPGFVQWISANIDARHSEQIFKMFKRTACRRCLWRWRRSRSGNCEEARRTASRQDLGRIRSRPGKHFLLHPPM